MFSLEEIYKEKTGHYPQEYVDNVEYCGPISYDVLYIEEDFVNWLKEIIMNNVDLAKLGKQS